MTEIDSGPLRLSLLSFAAFSIIALTAPWGSKGQDSPAPLASHNANSAQILLSVSVTDKHGQVPAKLSKDDFTLLDGKSPQQISLFEERDAPYSIGFLFDTSGSMVRQDKLRQDKQMLSIPRDNILRFVTRSHKANEYFFATFGERLELVMDWTRDANTIGDALDKLARVRPKGPTVFYDACYFGIEKLRDRSNPRRALILLTDGIDNVSKHSYKNLRELLKQSEVVIYVLDKGDPPAPLVGLGEGVLRELTSISGGAAFVTNDELKLNQVLDSIALEMQHQYTIGFNPASLDGKWHSIKIKIKPIEVPDSSRPDKPHKQISLSARNRQVFYAPKPSR